MRRQLRAALPQLSHWYGLKPWELDRLTFAEVDVYLAALPQGEE